MRSRHDDPVSAPIWRLKLALADLERATGERNLPAARYIMDTEVMEALDSIGRAKLVSDDLLDHLLDAIAGVQQVLWSDR